MKNPINIFIVDDNKVLSLALKADIESAFSKMSVKVYSFETGEKCMERFTQIMPEIVILDYHLDTKSPGAEDGLKVLDWIKKENHETNVVILTGEDHIDIAIRSFHHGASDYIVKSETKFKKINYSLFNIIKMMEARHDARTFKRMLIALFMCIALCAGGLLSIQLFAPELFKLK